jgi:regulator of nonsense transcripts 2
VILMFCRYCGDDFAGLVSQKMVNFANQYAFNIPKVHLLPHDKQKNVKALLKDYFESAAEHLKRLSKEIARIDRRNKEILMTKGDLDADKREQLNNMQLLSDKLNTSTESLADLLGEDMPDLTFRLESENKSDEEAFDNDEEDEEDKIDKQWEDDDTKSFYIDLIDIKAIVPGILFEAAKPDLDQNQADPPGSNPTADMASTDKSKIVEEQLDDIMDLEGLDGDDVLDPSNNFADDKEGIEDLEQDILKEEEMEKNEVGQNTSKKMLFDAFISNLPTCVNRVMIDNAAAEFCMTFNTKANRKKLVKALFSVNRNRIDLLPFYARFIATINPCAPDVSTDMSVLLKREFRWQVRKKDQMKIESKLKVCRFIGELVKFSLFESSDCIFCLKMLLFDFSHHNIEMACVMLETCGRFLFYSLTTRQRTKLCLEQMMRKKTALTLDARYVMMIENVYYNINPPDAPVCDMKQIKTPLQEYVHKLLYADLSRSKTEKVKYIHLNEYRSL